MAGNKISLPGKFLNLQHSPICHPSLWRKTYFSRISGDRVFCLSLSLSLNEPFITRWWIICDRFWGKTTLRCWTNVYHSVHKSGIKSLLSSLLGRPVGPVINHLLWTNLTQSKLTCTYLIGTICLFEVIKLASRKVSIPYCRLLDISAINLVPRLLSWVSWTRRCNPEFRGHWV